MAKKILIFACLLLILSAFCLIKRDFIIKFETLDRIIVINAFLLSGLLSFSSIYGNKNHVDYELLIFLMLMSLIIYLVIIFISNFCEEKDNNIYLIKSINFGFCWCISFTVCLFVDCFYLSRKILKK